MTTLGPPSFSEKVLVEISIVKLDCSSSLNSIVTLIYVFVLRYGLVLSLTALETVMWENVRSNNDISEAIHNHMVKDFYM